MTHTLHRTHNIPGGPDDLIVFSMIARGFNDVNAGPKLAAIFEILLRHAPVNAGDDNRGGLLTGETPENIMAGAGPTSYMAAVYTDQRQAEDALRDLKQADLGMPVVVTGHREQVFAMLRRVGLKPHTVNLSIGTFGKTESAPEPEVLDITSMCGHGMVCPDHARHVMEQVRAGRMTPSRAAEDLARPCTCAMFNPTRAEHVIRAVCHR
ncbi:MAG: hypothetical protein Q8P50_17050 [Bacillota bacterium]|nr:hypothetical protein [Bacillota bacterium]